MDHNYSYTPLTLRTRGDPNNICLTGTSGHIGMGYWVVKVGSVYGLSWEMCTGVFLNTCLKEFRNKNHLCLTFIKFTGVRCLTYLS